jgi:tRNA (adenine-N(1)-)-methyltransferase non-catalytic subunit
MDKETDLIVGDKYFLIIDNKNRRKFVTTQMKKINISKKVINLLFFEGKKLNTFWDVTNEDNYIEIKSKEFLNENKFEDEEIEYTNEKIIGNTNKEIYQSDNAQKLTDDEIKDLKEKTKNKDELIKTILENNTSMEKRTIFSQEKIIKKKTKKYKNLIWITSTSLFNIIETFFIIDPKIINYLRMDTISTMLINTNFMEGKTLIFEETNNILTQAYCMRTPYNGKVISLFKEKICNKNLNIFNLTRKQKSLISYMNINCFLNKKSFGYDIFIKKFQNYFSNLVICLKMDIEIPIYFFNLLPFLKYSGNIIIFGKDKEILINIDKILNENKLGIDTKIIETITREYQILELRTHPMINNKGYSGYVLVSYKAAPLEQ